MSRVVYYTAMSLDGFVADEHDRLDWLFAQEADPSGDLGFAEVDAGAGALIMGRRTFDWVVAELARTGDVWPHRQPCWVVTRREGAVPDGADVRFTGGPAAEVVAAARRAAGEKLVWCVGGGETATGLAAAGVLDEVWVAVAPVMLGAGSPVLSKRLDLELLTTGRNGDLVTARFRVRT